MDNLFWIQGKKTLNLLEKPFSSEDEFERKIADKKELVGDDIFIISRQTRGGNKPGIPDIIGVDTDGNVCIIEMKNVETDSSIIPQVLAYALWAEKNPDSIKSLMLERDDIPEDIQVDWSDYQVKIIVVAPKIDPSTLDAVSKINYEVDLIEVKRWVENSDEFLLVNKLEHTKTMKIKPVRGLGNYDKEFYELHRNKQSVKTFLEVADKINEIVKEQGWNLERKFNKHYCGFKYGNFNTFGIQWLGTKSFAIFFKIPKTLAKKYQPNNWKMEKYQDRWKMALYKVDEKKSAQDLLPLFQKSMEHIKQR